MSMRISTGQARTKRLLQPWPAAFYFRISRKMVPAICPFPFRLRRLAQNGCRSLGLRHFTWKFSRKMALVTCRCAFRRRRLAQNGCRGLGQRHSFWEFSNKIALATCPCAFRLRTLVKRSLWNTDKGITLEHSHCGIVLEHKLLHHIRPQPTNQTSDFLTGASLWKVHAIHSNTSTKKQRQWEI